MWVEFSRTKYTAAAATAASGQRISLCFYLCMYSSTTTLLGITF